MKTIIDALIAAGFRHYDHSLVALSNGPIRLFLKNGYWTVSGVAEGEVDGLVVETEKRDTTNCRHRLPLTEAATTAFIAALPSVQTLRTRGSKKAGDKASLKAYIAAASK